MTKSLAIAIGSAILIAAGAPLAQIPQAPGAEPTGAAAQSAAPMVMGSPMGQMDEHMKKMQTLHEKVASATTPEERQRLMGDQHREMQQGMAMMHSMHDGGSKSGGAGTGMMAGTGKPVDPKARMQMMEKRIDMMQMMMQTMMDQQGMTAGPAGSDPGSRK